MKNFRESVEKLASKSMAIYDSAMAKVLGVGGMRSYYKDAELFLRPMNQHFWHLDESQYQKMLESSPLNILGKEDVIKVIKQRLQYRALRAAMVTFLCTLPTNWIMWPLMLVDIIFFQREVFLFSQEVLMLCKPREEYERQGTAKFDYVNLAILVGKMLDPFVIRQVKNSAGIISRFAIKQGTLLFRGPLLIALRQGLKWLGVSASKSFLEASINISVIVCCALIAGFISYWLFKPMGMRMKKLLESEPARSPL